MRGAVDRRLVALCGSETRVRTLGVLANAFGPLTGYRIGRTAQVPLPKVYRELRRLQSARLVANTSGGWVLRDPDVGALLRKRYRVAWAGDWLRGISRRQSEDRRILDQLQSLPPPKFPKQWSPRGPRRLARRRGKDALLRRMGLEASLHG